MTTPLEADGRITLAAVHSEEAVQQIADMAKAIWTEHFTPIIGEAQVAYMLEKFQSKEAMRRQMTKEHYRYFRIESDGKAAGYTALVRPPEATDLLLSKFYIQKADRGKGVGKKAFAQIERIAKAEGLTAIRLTVNRNNQSSIDIYLKLGFVIEGETVFDIGGGFVMDDFLMRKAVPSASPRPIAVT